MMPVLISPIARCSSLASFCSTMRDDVTLFVAHDPPVARRGYPARTSAGRSPRRRFARSFCASVSARINGTSPYSTSTALPVVGHVFEALLQRMPGAELLGLLDEGQAVARHRRAHLIAAVADDDVDAPARARGAASTTCCEQRLRRRAGAAPLARRFHARALAGGENDDG